MDTEWEEYSAADKEWERVRCCGQRVGTVSRLEGDGEITQDPIVQRLRGLWIRCGEG